MNINKSIETVDDFGYKLIKDYIGKGGARRVIIQDDIGYKYDIYLWNLKRHLPNFVSVYNPFSISHNIPLWIKLNRPEFRLSEEETSYVGHNARLKFYHTLCKEYFHMSWSNFCSGKNNCPVCRGFQVGKANSLAYKRPDLAREWHQDNHLKPTEVTVSSNKKVYWICSKCGYGKNKEWIAIIQNRTKGRSGCSSCSGRVVTDKNRLSIVYPEISSDWHPTKNKGLNPDSVSYGSKKKVWWLCSKCNIEWCATVTSRTCVKSGCRNCFLINHESSLAKDLKNYLKEIYNTETEYRIFKNPETNRWLPYDIYIPHGEKPELNGIYIEVHGKQHYNFIPYWHKTKENFKYNRRLDRLKRKFSKDNGLYIEVDMRKIKTMDDSLNFIINKIEKYLNNK